MEHNDPAIAPSMLYAYAALMESVPFAQRRALPDRRRSRLQHLAEDADSDWRKDFKTGRR